MVLVVKGKKVKSIDSICKQLERALEKIVPAHEMDNVEFDNDIETSDKYIWSIATPAGENLQLQYIKENGYIYKKSI